MRTLKIATRGSALSLAQAALVQSKLEDHGYETELVTVATRGDRNRTESLRKIGGDGLFVREVERLLLSEEADIAVHSAKDLPYALLDTLTIAGIPDARDPRDMLLINAARRDDEAEYHVGRGIFGLPKDAVIGTGSPRRIAEAGALLPDAVFREIRGNINTRIEKLRTGSDGHLDAIILAKAGFERLQLPIDDLTKHIFSPPQMVPAPCQGLLAAECRAADEELCALLSRLTTEAARRRFTVERKLFTMLQADCTAAVGIYAELEGDDLTIYVRYREKKLVQIGTYADYETMCESIAAELLS